MDSVYDLEYVDGLKYGEIFHQREKEWSGYNFKVADVDLLLRNFTSCEDESKRCLEQGLVLPAYDYTLKSSHLFNLLDARQAISVTERTGYIARVRAMARATAESYLRQRAELGFPLLKGEARDGLLAHYSEWMTTEEEDE